MSIYSFNKNLKKILKKLFPYLRTALCLNEWFTNLAIDFSLRNATDDEKFRVFRMVSGLFFYKTKNKKEALRYAKKCFKFSDTDEEVILYYEGLLASLGEIDALRDLYFEIGRRYSQKKDVLHALKYLNLSRDVYSNNGYGDKYLSNKKISNIIRYLAINNKINDGVKLLSRRDVDRKKIKVGHIVFGLKHKNSIIINLISNFGKYGDCEKFEHTFYICESSNENREVEKENIEILKLSGVGIFQSSNIDKLESIHEVANQIIDDSVDVLLVTAVMACYEHFYLMMLLPGYILRIGLCYGSLEQYYSDSLDFTIASDSHIALNIPSNVAVVPVEISFNKPNPSIRLSFRDKYSINTDAVIIMSGGRPSKFLCREWWKAIIEILELNGNCYFIYSGVEVDPEFLTSLVPTQLRHRLIRLGWQSNLIETLAGADIFIDTFPSGGGVIVLMAQSLAIPVVTFEDNELLPFNQNDWNPASKYLPQSEYVIPRWNFELMKEKLQVLISNKNIRNSYAQNCETKYIEEYSRPERMIQRYEEIIYSKYKK